VPVGRHGCGLRLPFPHASDRGSGAAACRHPWREASSRGRYTSTALALARGSKVNPAGKPGVTMLLEHPFRVDSRVEKEARSLARHGYRVTVLAMREPDLPSVEEREGFTVRRIRVLTRRLPRRFARPARIAESLARYAFAALREGGAVYHCHSPYLLPAAALAASIRRRPLIYDSHELFTGLPGVRGFRRWLAARFEAAMLRFTAAVVVANEERIPAFRRVHPRYRKPVVTVNNCPETVGVGDAEKDIRRLAGLPQGVRVVLYIGLPGFNRGLGVVIESMDNWPDNAHLVSMGPRAPRAESELLSRARELQVEDRVHFTGPVPADEVPVWASSADVGVNLIQPEGLSYALSAPTKLFETMMAGIPQVASDLPGFRNALVDNGLGEAGVVVDPADVNAAGLAIASLLGDETRSGEMGRTARALAESTYNWSEQEKALIGLYDGILCSGG